MELKIEVSNPVFLTDKMYMKKRLFISPIMPGF